MAKMRTVAVSTVGMFVGLLLGAALVFGYFQWLAPQPVPTATSTPPSTPMHLNPATFRGLDANLYTQTSAEYRACCLQAYALARERVKAKMAAHGAGAKPPAVVLDLDETVIDNGAFQARQIRNGQAYDTKQWDAWEENDGDQVRLVPGAKEFLDELKAAKVRAVYITNRSERFRKQAHTFLKRLDIDVPEDQYLPLESPEKTDKTARRAKAAEAFDVLLLVGDNLRDFDEAFKLNKEKGADGRKAAVDERRSRFGTDWIILPNPLYGEWTKPLKNTPDDVEVLK